VHAAPLDAHARTHRALRGGGCGLLFEQDLRVIWHRARLEVLPQRQHRFAFAHVHPARHVLWLRLRLRGCFQAAGVLQRRVEVRQLAADEPDRVGLELDRSQPGMGEQGVDVAAAAQALVGLQRGKGEKGGGRG
jgi:hypothetical protein